MNRTFTIATREFASLFYSPVAYLVLFLFLLYMGILFGAFIFYPGAPSELRGVIDFSRYGLFFIVPLMTMSFFADEYRSGRIEMLRTSPITEFQLVLGKFLGAAMFYLVLVASTLIYVVLLAIYGQPDWLQTAAAYLGLILMGFMFVSIGLFFSACTQNQFVAAMASIFTLIFFGVISFFSTWLWTEIPVGKWFNIPLRAPLYYVGVGPHIADFGKGVVDTSHLAYFGLFTGLFLFLTYLLLESKKWR